MEGLRTLDAVLAAVLGLALLRGLWIGAVREAFSLAGLAAAAFAVQRWREPAGVWLQAHAPFETTELAARLLAAVALGAGVILAAAIASRLARRALRSAGLGLVDRLAGGALGLAEGALVAGALLFGAIALLGRDDAALAGTRSLAAYEQAETALGLSPTRPARPSAPARE